MRERAREDGEALAALLAQSRCTVALTGAGISTESGIPDYRSPGGMWERFKPVPFQDFVASEAMRREFWRRKFATHDIIANAQPNRGHRALARLMAQGRLEAVVTQNVDGLHQKSGIAGERLIELHGNTTYALCLDCRRRFALEPIRADFEIRDRLPICGDCGGLVKTATIAFGQTVPVLDLRRAQTLAGECALFLAIGSSLGVHPAATLPLRAKRAGARLVIVNREPTPLDGAADAIFRRPIGALLESALDRLG